MASHSVAAISVPQLLVPPMLLGRTSSSPPTQQYASASASVSASASGSGNLQRSRRDWERAGQVHHRLGGLRGRVIQQGITSRERRDGHGCDATGVTTSEHRLGRRIKIGRGRSSSNFRAERKRTVVSAGLWDFWGGDLLGLDLDQWSKDVEDYGSIAVYAPHEGGYEGRYITRLRHEGYHFMNISARGLGDPEAYLTKIHGVRPAHLGKQAIECFYFPPQLDHRLSALPKDSKGIVLWVIEAKVLSKTELQYLALLPAFRPKVKVIAECGTWRKYRWKPLREACGLPSTKLKETTQTSDPIEKPKATETTEAPKAIVTKS